jgi:uncharacterized protein YbaR (Trm112 family)
MADPAARGEEDTGQVPADLLDLLCCPLGKAPLRLEGSALVCTKCGLTYAIEDGLPNMIIDDAKLPAGVADLRQVACWEGSSRSRSSAGTG